MTEARHSRSHSRPPARRRLSVCGLAVGLACVACSPAIDLGSDVTWATDHESGTLNDWLLPGGGIFQDDKVNDTVTIAAGPAHSGKFSVQLSNGGENDSEGPAVFRELVEPPDAYYSAWYYLPRS